MHNPKFSKNYFIMKKVCLNGRAKHGNYVTKVVNIWRNLVWASLLRCNDLRLLWLLDGQEQFELGRQFVFRVEAIGEVNASDPTVGMNLNSQGLDVIRSIGTAGEVGQVELNLVPSFLKYQKFRSWWSPVDCTNFNSRQVSSASCKWKASPSSSTGNCWPWSVVARSYRRGP